MRVSFNHTQLCIVSLGLRQQVRFWEEQSIAAYNRNDRKRGAKLSADAQEARAALAKVDKLLLADDERQRNERDDDQTGVLCNECGNPIAYAGSSCDYCWRNERDEREEIEHNRRMGI